MELGFRWHLKGAQYFYNVDPDLCTFGKAMANGFAVAALCGKTKIMSQGSIRNIGAERVFLTSTTHGAEMSSLGAFIKTIEILKRDNIIQHVWDYGSNLIQEANSLSEKLMQQGSLTFGGTLSGDFSTVTEKKTKTKRQSRKLRTTRGRKR